MTDAEQKLHDDAADRLIETWVELNGWTPRTFNLEEMPTDEINELTAGEIAAHDDSTKKIVAAKQVNRTKGAK